MCPTPIWEARCRVWTALLHRKATQPVPERHGKRGGSQPRGGKRRKERQPEAQEVRRQGKRAAEGLHEEMMDLVKEAGCTQDHPFPFDPMHKYDLRRMGQFESPIWNHSGELHKRLKQIAAGIKDHLNQS